MRECLNPECSNGIVRDVSFCCRACATRARRIKLRDHRRLARALDTILEQLGLEAAEKIEVSREFRAWAYSNERALAVTLWGGRV